ncbi:MAG: hypothetical protein MI919_07355, partial [Holophagales bacterium]|nr:hypothetical protein [Holophagales bacterium]
PIALLLTLFNNFAGDNRGEIAVVGRNEFGERVADSMDVKLLGNLNTTIVGNSRALVNPRTWTKDTVVTISINDKQKAIDENSEILVVGPGGDKPLEDVERQGNRVVGTLKAEDALAVIGPGMEDVNYTIVVTGPGTANKTAFFAKAMVQAVPDGDGGGDDCLDFDPPGSHNIPLGECEYLHPPGLSEPFANNCGVCHGSDLRGSSIGPSCFLCHDAIWQTAPPAAPRVRK